MNIRSLSFTVYVAVFTATGFAQTTSTPTGQGGLVLDRGWATPMQGGSATMADLGALLSPFAKPSANMGFSPGLKIFEGVTYLMPYDEARRAMNLTQKVVVKSKVVCPGFPRDSFFHYAFDGNFDGHFNKLYLVVDKADQVATSEPWFCHHHLRLSLCRTAGRRIAMSTTGVNMTGVTMSFCNGRHGTRGRHRRLLGSDDHILAQCI